jgi:hypothetical protein
MHVGYRHFGAFGANHKLKADLLGEVNPGTPGSESKLDKSVAGQESLPVGLEKQEDINIDRGLFTTHGIEAGLTFHFASKS